VKQRLTGFAETLLSPGQLLPRVTTQAVGAVPWEDKVDQYVTPTPHAWNVPVDRPGAFEEMPPGRDEDLTQRVAGVGVVLRQAAAAPTDPDQPFQGQPWRLLNAADVVALPTEETPGTVTQRAAVPVRGRYQDDARQTVIRYDNQPLTAASPLAGVSVAKQSLAETGPPGAFGPFRYLPATPSGGAADPCGALPTLKFGQFYELAAFLLGNNGALPKALTSAHPAALRGAAIPEDLSSAGAGLLRWRYLRRVGVGQPRLAPKPGSPSMMNRPEPVAEFKIPRGVLPLARELGLRATSPARPAERFYFDTAKGAGPAPGVKWAVALRGWW
jgi:hypothetical protein